MNDIADTELQAWLRQDFEGPVADAGFTDRVMRQLPPRRRRPSLLPASAAVGGVLAWLALAATPLGPLVAREWTAAELGAGSVALYALLLATGVLASAWALEEGP